MNKIAYKSKLIYLLLILIELAVGIIDDVFIEEPFNRNYFYRELFAFLMIAMLIIILQSRYKRNGVNFTSVLFIVELVALLYFSSPIFDRNIFIYLDIYPFHFLFNILTSKNIFMIITYSELIIFLYKEKLTISSMFKFWDDIKNIW